MAVLNEEGEEYEVTGKDGTKHHHHRRDLQHKQNHNIVFAHVSDDKSHDSYAIQHITINELCELEKFMVENFPEDLSSGNVECLHTKLEKPASHFKSRKLTNYFSWLLNEREGPSK